MSDADVEAVRDRAAESLSDETVIEGIVRAGTLQQFVDTLTPLVEEGRVHFGDHGLRTSVVDPANVATYCPVELAADAFEHFDAPGQLTIGVDFTTLDDRLGLANSNDLLHLAVDMETRKLVVQYRNITQSIGLIDSEAVRSEPDKPDLELPNAATVTGEQFATAIKACDETGDHVTIRGHPEESRFVIVAEGDVDDTTVEFGREETIDAQITEPVESILSLEYLGEFAQPLPDDAEVSLRFGEEFPLMFQYETCDGHLTVEAMQAPRISTN